MSNPTDPNAFIPPAVRALGAQAEEIHKQAYAAPQDTPAPVEPAPVEPAPAPVEPAPVTITPQGNAPVDDNDQSWKHKYNSINGRYKRAEQTIREMGERMAQLENMVTQMRNAPRQEPPKELKAERLITPEEETNWGQELLTVVGKKAKETLTPEVIEIKNKMDELNRRLDTVDKNVTLSAREKLYAVLDEKCPNWNELNQNQDFISWLGLRDPFSGAIRHNLLNQAYEQNDAPRVLKFFEGFLAEEAVTAPRQNNQPDPVPGAVQKVPLETFAAPGRAKSTAPNNPVEKPIITRAEITRFYMDKAAGRYRGREDAANKFEADIFKAENEGRIR